MEEQTNESIVKHFAKKGFLIDREVSDFFLNLNDIILAENILNKLFMITKQRVISHFLLSENQNEIKPLFNKETKEKNLAIDFFISKQPKINPLPTIKARTEFKQTPKVKILSSNIIPYRRIEVKDFVTHFKNRYNFFKEIIKERKELSNLVSINKIGNNRSFSIIGIVSNKRITKNKNMILEIEDPTGRINALIGADKEDIFKKAKEIILDDVIGIKCSGTGEIIFVNDIFLPEGHLLERKKMEDEVYALFLSDIHVGSKFFLRKNFERFLDWINGVGADENTREKLAKIKYIFITGDNVDGVGIYPSQESFLEIKDMKDQYRRLYEYLDRIPKHITMIMCPGQHDAVRVPEPQPPVDEEFAPDLIKMNNLLLVSNPSFIEIDSSEKKVGFKVLIYHGASMHTWIDELEELRMGQANLNPSKVVRHMLKHRHLSPMHSGNVYVPSEKEDMLIIKETPDILATGDMHRTDVDMFNNVLVICGSCWQSITPFEEKVGNIPDPCKVPMINLKTREIKILDFSSVEEKQEKECVETNDKLVCEVKK
jgi:DNA polymerase II small subunit